MSKMKLGTMIAVGLVTLATHQQLHAISLDVGTAGNAVLRFNGASDTFTFLDSTTGPSTGFDFVINGSDGSGDALGLFGSISGTFTIGPIFNGGFFQAAPVFGSGTLNIFDGSVNFTADIDWQSITSQGTAVFLNSGGAFNIQNAAYTGSVLDLIALRDELNGIGVASLSATFIPAQTLTQLTTGGINDTSYSADLQASQTLLTPDGGATIGMLGLGLLALGAIRRKK